MSDSVVKSGRPVADPTGVCVRDRLLDAAGRLFYAEGIRAVGIDRILDEAGAAKASLYSHFSSKDALVAAYLDARATDTRGIIEAGLERAGRDPRARLLALFDGAKEITGADGFRGCPFQRAAAELNDVAHPGHAITVRERLWMQQVITTLVQEIAPEASPDLAAAIGALYEGAAVQASLGTAAAALTSARWAVTQLLPQPG
jgi:AcrR family transcriptional regulator